jgi:hypothetical protein
MSISDEDATDQEVEERINELRAEGKVPFVHCILEGIPVIYLNEVG